MNEETQVQTVSRKIVKKITAKIVMNGKPDIEKLVLFLNRPENKDHPETVMPMFNVIGLASDFTTGQSDFGAYVKLLGQFKAVNLDTGEEFRSGACMLPGSGNDMVYGALRGLGDGGGAVEFAFRVGIKRDKTSATGYVYDVEQVVAAGQNDPLAALEKRLSGPKPLAALIDAHNAATEAEKKGGADGKKKAA